MEQKISRLCELAKKREEIDNEIKELMGEKATPIKAKRKYKKKTGPGRKKSGLKVYKYFCNSCQKDFESAMGIKDVSCNHCKSTDVAQM